MSLDDQNTLHAEVRTPSGFEWRTLNLDSVLGNQGGQFVWGSSGFSSSRIWSNEYNKETQTLTAHLEDARGLPTKCSVRLTDFVRVLDGQLVGPDIRTINNETIPVPAVFAIMTGAVTWLTLPSSCRKPEVLRINKSINT
jgi:hypothetical protein